MYMYPLHDTQQQIHLALRNMCTGRACNDTVCNRAQPAWDVPFLNT